LRHWRNRLIEHRSLPYALIMHPLLWPWFSAKHKINWGLVPRPHYAYCLYQAARLAKLLGVVRISALEFGVAGGNGLIVMEQHARWIERELGVHLEIYGARTATADVGWRLHQGAFPESLSSCRCRIPNRRRLAPACRTLCSSWTRFACSCYC